MATGVLIGRDTRQSIASKDMIKIGVRDDGAQKAKSEAISKVSDWIEGFLPEEEKDEEFGGKAPPGGETSVIVNQLECKEPGCPPVELVLTLLRSKKSGRPKLMFKIFKAAIDVTQEEVKAAMDKAIAEEAGVETKKEHSHDHDEKKHDEHGHQHAEDGSCCGHDHDDHKEEHGHHESEHGHHEKKEHGHHEHSGDCCGHDHGHDEHGHDEKRHDHGHK